MANYFREPRNVERSVYKYLESEFDSNWTGINKVLSFKDAYKEDLPVVCVRESDDISTRREVGSNSLVSDYLIIVDIFAKDDGQRMDLAAFIKDKIKEGCVYYIFSNNPVNKQEILETASGRLTFRNFVANRKIDFGDSPIAHDRFRHIISFNMRRNYSG